MDDCKITKIQSWFGEIIIKYKYDGRNMYIESTELKSPPSKIHLRRIIEHCQDLLKEPTKSEDS